MTAFNQHGLGAVYAGTSQGVFRSTDGGQTWTRTTLDGGVDVLVINSLGHIFVGYGTVGILRSTDEGQTWVRMNEGLGSILPPPFFLLPLYALAVTEADHLFLGEFDGVLRSTDNGQTWTPSSRGLGFLSPFAMLVERTGALWAGGAAALVAGGGELYRSTDNGQTWTPTSTGLLNPVVRSLSQGPSDRIFASTRGGGVYRSK